MKRLLLYIFVSFILCGYAAANPFPDRGNDGIAAGVAEEEYVTISNATGESIRITYNFKTSKVLKIYNLLGKNVYSVRLSPGQNSVDLSVNLDKGAYIYSVEDGAKTISAKKFIVK
ncbi:hypothetical protein M2132_000894 [Dysgonomonas sp. PH5-45]|uniref:T9SS type A sorting domain-containing protein n=1 Tax=unclassified Dysgonomonas TaxID=2630389 RepID=UPI00247358C1|nr:MULTISPECIES: T9SS type A sorting domain-containing protein [unclassified Dysgonomonas]MDH6354566.1 hypothetical protein [Dysgonomonas sp. PH5-45]MDH6387378.1 hypothetical protein [Dysgonomonas sp. PH5-37]